MFGDPRDPSYRRSNAALTLPVKPGVVTRGLAMRVLDAGEEAGDRQRAGQLLLNDLDHAAGLLPVALVVADRRQVNTHDGQRLQSRTYGYYRCWFEAGRVDRARIRIYHRTAVRGQVISPKVFLNTLLHEWGHHWDFAGLRLSRSPHTAGFYARLRFLADALEVGMVLPPEREAENAPGVRRGTAASTRVRPRA